MEKTITKKEALDNVDTLISSCEEGIDGRWDCSTPEGLEGFEAMITLLKEVKGYIKKTLPTPYK